MRAELGRADHRPGRDERILFGGVIWCAECGAVCSHIQPNHKKERGGTAKWKCRNYVTGRAKNCRNSFITDGQAKQVCVEAINAVIRNKGLLRVQRQEEKLSPQYRVLERNLQHMKEEQERTETDLMKLLYERAEERYRTLEVRDGEFRTEEIKNILAGKRNWKHLMKIYIENNRTHLGAWWKHGRSGAYQWEPCHSRIQGLGGRADGRNSKKISMIPAKVQYDRNVKLSEKKMKVAAYCRVSTELEEQDSSYEAQVEYYTSKISENENWKNAGIYADDGKSGTNTKKRADFNAMIQDALAGKIDMILTKSVSRFARNTVDSLVTIRKLKEKNVAVVFEKEGINTLEGTGEILITILSSLAQEESRNISENIRWGVVRKFEKARSS